jgi:hypothetical protein
MVFSLEHDIKVTKNHQNLLPTQSVLVAHTVVYLTSLCVNRGPLNGPLMPKKAQFRQERVEYNVFLFDEPLKGLKLA